MLEEGEQDQLHSSHESHIMQNVDRKKVCVEERGPEEENDPAEWEAMPELEESDSQSSSLGGGDGGQGGKGSQDGGKGGAGGGSNGDGGQGGKGSQDGKGGKGKGMPEA